jgi:hypothetical protein
VGLGKSKKGNSVEVSEQVERWGYLLSSQVTISVRSESLLTTLIEKCVK